MTSYTVYLPPAGTAERAAGEKTRFIAEAGAFLALVFPLLWLAFNRLWFGLIGYILIVAALALLATIYESPAFGLISMIPAIYYFLEGRELIRHRLERKGWRFAGVVVAENAAEAEERWFDAHPPAASARAPLAPLVANPQAHNATAAEPAAPSIGIFGQ